MRLASSVAGCWTVLVAWPIKTSSPTGPGTSHRRRGGRDRHREGFGDIMVLRGCLGPGGNF